MGRRGRAKGRKINGIFLLNKPSGISSNHALQRVKRLFKAAKAGHTGSLDPLASGLLPICLGEATKFSQYLLDSDKRYQVRALLGQKTTTADAEGEIIESKSVDVSEAEFLSVMKSFLGDIEQVPSMFSALKVDGQPLYKLARQGQTVERKARPIKIHEITMTHFDSPYVEMDVFCSKGTYIRNLVEDIGDKLGCGAHVTQLHRTRVGPFIGDAMLSLDEATEILEKQGPEFLDKQLLPVDEAVSSWPKVVLDNSLSFYIQQGQPIQYSGLSTDTPVRLYTENDEFIGIAALNDDGLLAPKRLVSQV